MDYVKMQRGVLRGHPVEWIADAFFVVGNGMRWVKGQLGSVTGRGDDLPFCTSLEGRKPSRDTSWVPMISGLEKYSLYPQSWTFSGKLGRAPADIDIYWLAAGLIVIKTLLTDGTKSLGEYRLSGDARKHQETTNRSVLAATLDVLVEIAEYRGRDGVERAFKEIKEAFGTS